MSNVQRENLDSLICMLNVISTEVRMHGVEKSNPHCHVNRSGDTYSKRHVDRSGDIYSVLNG